MDNKADYKAFVSSTFVDLKEHRAHVISELRKAGFFVDPMEEWTSDAQQPKVLSTNRLDGCRLCILLVARRRGHVPAGDTLSITQQEVAEAQRKGIDVLTFLLDDGLPEADWPWDVADRSAVEAWHKDLREHSVISPFTKDPKSVALSPALTRWVKAKGAQVALDLYLKLVEQEHGTIQFVGLPQLKDTPNAPIHRLYVEPALAKQQVSPDTDPKEWPETTPVLDVMAKERKLVVLGDPGSGKSTLVSWITWQLAHHHHNGFSPWTEQLGPLIPLPFILRNLGIGQGVTWDTLLRAFLDQPIAKLLDMADLQKILDEGRAIIMLDGLDEIGNPAVRHDLRDAVWEAFDNYPKCRWLLTSRIVGYSEVGFDSQQVQALYWGDFGEFVTNTAHRAKLRYVAPFDDAHVERFADNWFMLREDAEWKRQQMSRELVEAVRGHDSTTKLGRIPNLLTMMALIYRVRARLPNGRALLYSEIAQAYLETIDYQRKIFVRSESLAEKKRWLARVGFEMQRGRSAEEAKRDPNKPGERKEILATGAQVRQWVAAAMAESGKEGSDDDAAGFVDYLAKRSGLLLPRGQDQFAFLHLSFQEFFAASFLAQKIVTPAWLMGDARKIPEGARKPDLERCANDSVWRETLVFLIELLAAEQQDWLPVARNCLFGEDLSAVVLSPDDTVEPSKPVKNQNRVALLARLAIDPQAGFDPPEKERAIQASCRWEMAVQKRREGNVWAHDNLVARTLLTADKDERRKISDVLMAAAHELRITEINLTNTQISDISALKGLTALTTLYLNRTQVSDISSLRGLTALTRLSLVDTQVSDVSVLRGLTALNYLDLRSTPVSDVSALQGLTTLTMLDLGHTSVSDVSALQGLTSLKGLGLMYTPVSDISALKGLTALETLFLKHTQVSDVSALKGLTALTDLYLSGTQVKDVSSLEGPTIHL